MDSENIVLGKTIEGSNGLKIQGLETTISRLEVKESLSAPILSSDVGLIANALASQSLTPVTLNVNQAGITSEFLKWSNNTAVLAITFADYNGTDPPVFTFPTPSVPDAISDIVQLSGVQATISPRQTEVGTLFYASNVKLQSPPDGNPNAIQVAVQKILPSGAFSSDDNMQIFLNFQWTTSAIVDPEASSQASE